MPATTVVVDLTSSSPSPQKFKHPPSDNGSASRIRAIFDINSDDFDFTGMSGDMDIPVPHLVKKRRLNSVNDENDEHREPPGSARKSTDLSEEEILPRPKDSKTTSANFRSTILTVDSRVSDDIQFTSSAPEARKSTKLVARKVVDLSDDLDQEFPGWKLDASFPSLSQPEAGASSKGVLSERTANLLANLNTKTLKRAGGPAVSKFRRKNAATSTSLVIKSIGDIDDILSATPEQQPAQKPRSKLTDVERNAKATEKAVTKAVKDLETEAAKEQKRLAKERKAQEKQKAADIAEVNKSKTDKKESIKEMTLDVPRSLEKTSIGNQVEAYMEKLEVKISYYDEQIDMSESADLRTQPVGNVIKWRRKIEGVYDPELDHFQPLAQTRIEKENHILIHLTGTDFAALAARQHNDTIAHISETAMKANLDAHVHDVKRKYKDCTPIYLIEGLATLVRKNKNAKNRDYQAAARSANVDNSTNDTTAPTASQKSRKRKAPHASAADVSFFTHELSQALLLHLQVAHTPGLLIHHVSNPSQTAHWITVFTSHLSTRPYKLLRSNFNDTHAGFCMDSGQVKTGEDAQDTYIRMLQELPRVTASMAHGIREEEWGSVRELVQGFRREGRLMLEDVKKAVNKDGGLSERRIGPSVSKRLYRVFFSNDPDELSI